MSAAVTTDHVYTLPLTGDVQNRNVDRVRQEISGVLGLGVGGGGGKQLKGMRFLCGVRKPF